MTYIGVPMSTLKNVIGNISKNCRGLYTFLLFRLNAYYKEPFMVCQVGMIIPLNENGTIDRYGQHGIDEISARCQGLQGRDITAWSGIRGYKRPYWDEHYVIG